jgi:hypothetical protein
MCFDGQLAEGETEAARTRTRQLTRWSLPKLLEDPFPVFRRNARTLIGDAEAYPTICMGEDNADFPAAPSKLVRVTDQISHHAADDTGITGDGNRLVGQLVADAHAVRCGAEVSHGSMEEGNQVGFSDGKRHLPGFEPTHIQNLTDHLSQSTRNDSCVGAEFHGLRVSVCV